ncbi:MAG: DUF2917 domain-containing protein [Burkholderiales bacterium]|jgi:hypothetical protein|nr:DUF2917 domain-containing protein [Burkholderiales bacterium]
MTTTTATSIPLDGPLHLIPNETAILRAPRGAALFVVRGRVWLTQDGASDDIVLAAGQRHDVPPGAQIVVGGLRGEAAAFALPALDGAAADLHDALRLRAARLRSAAASQFWGDLARSARRLTGRLVSAWAKPPQATAASSTLSSCVR